MITSDLFIDFDPDPSTVGKQRAPRLVVLSAGRFGLWGRPSVRAFSLWHSLGLTTVVSLLSEAEGAPRLGESVRRAGLDWFWFEQENGKNLPLERQIVLLDLLTQVNLRIDAGAWVLIHCAAGMHRTGMAVYALLRLRGIPRPEALELIRLSRQVTYEGVGSNRLQWVENWLANR